MLRQADQVGMSGRFEGSELFTQRAEGGFDDGISTVFVFA
jgi:hypothetical protein